MARKDIQDSLDQVIDPVSLRKLIDDFDFKKWIEAAERDPRGFELRRQVAIEIMKSIYAAKYDENIIRFHRNK